MFAALYAMPAGSQTSCQHGRAPVGASAWLAGMCRKVSSWAGSSTAGTAREGRRRQVRHLAEQKGYVCLDVDGENPIEMLLLRRGERVIVLSERAARIPNSRIQMLLEAADASAAWAVGLDETDEPVREIRVARAALA